MARSVRVLFGNDRSGTENGVQTNFRGLVLNSSEQ